MYEPDRLVLSFLRMAEAEAEVLCAANVQESSGNYGFPIRSGMTKEICHFASFLITALIWIMSGGNSMVTVSQTRSLLTSKYP